MNSPSVQDEIQNYTLKRVQQLVWAALAALVSSSILLLARHAWLELLVVAAMTLSLSPCLYWNRVGKGERSAQLLLMVLAVGISGFFWVSSGLYDLSLIALPGLLVFAAMVSMYRMFAILLLICVINVLGLGFAEELELLTFTTRSTGFYRALSIISIFLPLSLSIWILASDYRNVLTRLKKQIKMLKESAHEVEFLASHDVLTRFSGIIDRDEGTRSWAEIEIVPEQGQ